MDYNKLLTESKKINFLPYIGENYNITVRKILVLGESHYGPLSKNTDIYWTNRVVREEYLNDLSNGIKNPWIKGYRNTAATITGEGYHCSDYIWSQLAFYNFFQKTIGLKPDDKQFLSNELINESREAFWDILKILKPDVVIVWGRSKLLDNWLPIDNRIEFEGKYLFQYKDFDCYFWGIKHPSRSFSYDKFHLEWKYIEDKYL